VSRSDAATLAELVAKYGRRWPCVTNPYGSRMTQSLRLVPITPANIEAAIAVKVHPDQERFVAPVVQSLAEAYVHPEGGLAAPHPRRRPSRGLPHGLPR
jgi:hypothetical protein